MNILKIKLSFICLFILCFHLSSQMKLELPDFKAMDAKIDSLRKHVDFLSLDYKYLDGNYNITMDSVLFRQAIKKNNFFSDRLYKYTDSLAVVLMYEFNDWDKTRIAKNTISYTWLRLSYHTWQTKEEAKDYANSFGITHPWRMREFLIDEDNDNAKVLAFLEDVRKKVDQVSKRDVCQLSRKDLLTAAMRCNPQRIADWQKLQDEKKRQKEAYLKEHGQVDKSKLGVGCGKANCCQSKGK